MTPIFPYKIVKREVSDECCKKVEALESEISQATDFIKNIEQGNLEAEFAFVDHHSQLDKDSLSGSLISMRDQMKHIAEQEKERNWATEGLAKFVEILRSNDDNLSSLSDKILSNLVKYLKANQGYLFILNENQSDKNLELTACYAYNKKKYVNKTIAIGEGLVGQCYLEKDTIYLTDVPESFVNIKSGLGESLPKNIIIVPLKMNEEVYGIVEMASFSKIEKYQIEFLEKLGESIASTIANTKVAERTQKLLTDAQVMAEQMRSQEEEMRQNMEELAATQEEMQRKQADALYSSIYMNHVINATKDIIFTIDRDYKIVQCNDALKNLANGKNFKLGVGSDSTLVIGADIAKQGSYKDNIQKVFRGEQVQLKEYVLEGGVGLYLDSLYAPIRNTENEIIGVAVFIKNITELTLARLETEKLLAAAQLQTDGLKAQEEEMRQNMEELSATQDELERTAIEIEEIRSIEKERADSQIASQKKIMEQFIQKSKEKESQMLDKIKQLERQNAIEA